MSVISREIMQRSTCANVTALGGTNILLDPKQRVECHFILFPSLLRVHTHGTSRSPGRFYVSSQRGNKEKYSLSSGRNTRSYQGEILFVIRGKSHKKAAKLPN